MIRSSGTTSIVVLVCTLACVFLLLLVPIPDGRHHRIVGGLLNLGHVPLFAAVSWIAFRWLGSSWFVLVGLMGLVGLGELVQTVRPGRTADWSDLLLGFVGVALAWVWNPWGNKGLLRGSSRALWTAGFLVVPVVAIGPDMFDAIVAWGQFPVLSDFSSPWQRYRWKMQQARWAKVDGLTELVFEPGPQEYSGAELIPIHTDWSGYTRLVVEYETADPINVEMVIRDQRRQWGYGERFNAVLPPGRGRQRVEYDLESVYEGPVTSRLDSRLLDSIQFYVSAPEKLTPLVIHRVALE